VFQLFHNWVNFGTERRNFLRHSKVLKELSGIKAGCLGMLRPPNALWNRHTKD
jgi:hypothetical protein